MKHALIGAVVSLLLANVGPLLVGAVAFGIDASWESPRHVTLLMRLVVLVALGSILRYVVEGRVELSTGVFRLVDEVLLYVWILPGPRVEAAVATHDEFNCLFYRR